MNLTNERKLFEGSVTLSANQLIPSKVTVDDDELSKFSSDLFATIDDDDDCKGCLHFRFFDGTSEEFDPSLTFETKIISEVCLGFRQDGDEYEPRFVYDVENAKFIFLDGEEKAIKLKLKLNGLPLIFAAKVFFVDVVRSIVSSDNSSYSLKP